MSQFRPGPKPANASKRIKLFEVCQNGVSRGFCWTDGHARVIAPRQDGYAAKK